MPTSRARTTAQIRADLEATERRLQELVSAWRLNCTVPTLESDPPSRETLDRVELVLRNQRGAVERLHQLWIEYAQALGHHAPQ